MASRKVTRKKTGAASSGGTARNPASTKGSAARKTSKKSATKAPAKTTVKKRSPAKKAAAKTTARSAASRPTPAPSDAIPTPGGETALLGRGPGWWAPSRSKGKPGTPVAEEFRRHPEVAAEPIPAEPGTSIPVGIFAPSQPLDASESPGTEDDVEVPQDDLLPHPDAPADDVTPDEAQVDEVAPEEASADEAPATPEALPDLAELEAELDGAELDSIGDDSREAALLAEALELLGEAEDVIIPEAPTLQEMLLEEPAPQLEDLIEPPLEAVGAEVETDPGPAEAEADDTPQDIQSLDDQLAADVDGMPEGDYEAVDDLLDGVFDESESESESDSPPAPAPVPAEAESSEITAAETPAENTDEGVIAPLDFVAEADKGVDKTPEPGADTSDPPVTVAAVAEPEAVESPAPDAGRDTAAATGEAEPRGPSMFVRVLQMMNYPLRTLPPSMRTVVDWIALSMLFWIPIVWLVAMFVIGR